MAEQGVRFKARRVIGNFLRDDIAYSIDDLFQVLRCEFAFIDTHGLAEVGKVERIERLEEEKRALIADLQAASAPPAEALDIHVRSLIELPSHGATLYTWLTIRSIILRLADLEADEEVAVLAGALNASPLKLDRSARNAVEKAKARLGNPAFESATTLGSRFDPAEARRYIIEAWRSVLANRARPASMSAKF